MGTTLTGTTPQDTYDSLIKVTDNGPLSGTAKYLSDGLGNDSVLALSTTSVGIGVASPVEKLEVGGTAIIKTGSGTTVLAVSDTSTGGKQYSLISAGTGNVHSVPTGSFYIRNSSDSITAATITSTGNVGIGTSSPESKLHISGSASGSDVTLYIDNAAGSTLNNSSRLKFSSDLGSNVSNGGAELNCTIVDAGNGAVDLVIKSYTGSAYTEKARFLAAGGLTFNGDTAAANALDDYEEGTFTVTASPISSGSITLSTATGSYTKIGNQVSITAFLVVGSVSLPLGAYITMGGLPFSIPNFDRYAGAPSVTYFDAPAYTAQVRPSYIVKNTSGFNVAIDASTVGALDEFYINLTYFV